jgi:aminomethyltransferase
VSSRSEAKRSPLDAEHRALGAKMVPFGGWEMPLAYPAGTIEEHLACRRDAVVFDVSHLGTVRVDRAGAHDALQAELTNDLDKIGPGRAQYTHLLDADDASVLDDLIVWWRAGDVFDVMPNASNTDRVRAAVGGEDVTESRAVLAVQGPQARQRLEGVFPEAAAVGRFRVAEGSWRGTPCTIAGTGYTGEAGVEISVPADAASALWRALVDSGVQPAGLGARDTLRLEAALPLHGHELGPGITPLQAGLGWVVSWSKPTFRGRDALAAERERGVTRLLRGIATEGRRPPRAECPVTVDGGPAGATTSGNFSPVLGHGIALAFLPPGIEDGAPVEVELRGTALTGTVVATPFVRSG